MSELGDAIKMVTILQMADYLGVEGLKLGMNSSPFRQVKSGQPFSITQQGYVFKDHGHEEHRGNAWAFLELHSPNLPPGERAEIIFKLAGVEPSKGGFDKEAYRRHKKENRKQAYKARDAEFLKLKEFDAPEPWTPTVEAQWNDGAARVPVKRLATSRGWPEEWVEWLIHLGKVSFPWMPWASPQYPKARHGLAFKVEAPWFTMGTWTGMKTCGYHQQWLHADKKTGARKKDWLFIPNIPNGEKLSTDFQRALHREQKRVSPFPMIINEMVSPKNIIITEGQWDAITIAGAAGWLTDSAAPNTMIFGLRGSQSHEVFLAFYGKWLRAIKPNVLLLPDNDTAGRKWIDPIDDNKILPTPTFAQRLLAWGCKRVEHRSIDPKYGKDFNDYYKARTPDAAAMHDWLLSCGLEFE